MVPDTDAVVAIARDQGMLAALAPGAIWAQMSTIGVAGTEQVAAMVAAEHPEVVLLDAPVSGSRDPAEQGQLTIFASGRGGPPARRCPVRCAGPAHRLGRPGWGRIPGEAGEQHPGRVRGRRGRQRGGPGGSVGAGDRDGHRGPGRRPAGVPWQAAKLQRIARGEFSAQFALRLALKDVRLALQAADGDRFTAFACLAEEWQQAAEQGLGDQDLTVVARAGSSSRDGRHDRHPTPR
jgi:3-hydroxyisobutyrate dehydrogenase